MTGCITIYTDASVNHVTQTGGWACWIKTAPGETALYAGAFKAPVSCAAEAELMAIANGLAAARKAIGTQPYIVVVTDCAAAITYIQHARTRSSPKPGFKVKALKPGMFEIAKSIVGAVPPGVELRINKVKAHTGAADKRSHVNDVVDKAARRARKQAEKVATASALPSRSASPRRRHTAPGIA